jgi:adenylate cyclase class 2
MSNADQEIEAKFMVRDLAALEQRLQTSGARLVSDRVHETNLRFDNSTGSLSKARQALRLRQDVNAILTFKGAASPDQEAAVRQEIEFQVSDFGAARRFLEALGFHVSVMYEKYRTTYLLGDVLVTLDEMPYGSFAEIEGAGTGDIDDTIASVRTVAALLGLHWDARSSFSYLALFDYLRRTRKLEIGHLTFEGLKDVPVQPEDLGLQFAD